MSESGYQVTAHLEFGEPTEQIVRLANELPAELILVGHKRRTSLASRWWHGGEARKNASPNRALLSGRIDHSGH
jgi:nucleotide-binding universal stress UspA family protein